jgi:NitT/TauT family transport system ATP-binding protein
MGRIASDPLYQERRESRPDEAMGRSGVSDCVVSMVDVAKTFDNGLEALRGISLSVQPGEFISLLGPSGCGKSTILRLLAGLTPVSRGHIAWGDTVRRREGTARPELAFVFQEATLMPWRTVEGNVAIPLVLGGLPQPEVKARVAQAIEAVGLTAHARTYPRQLSGGMKMRVSIARALVTRPTVLLMDEPFGALDELTRQKLNQDLVDLWRRERLTILFVTHNVYEAVYLSSRIIVMTPQPGTIHSDTPLDATVDRDDDFRASSTYIRSCEQVSRRLRAAMEGRVGEPGTP